MVELNNTRARIEAHLDELFHSFTDGSLAEMIQDVFTAVEKILLLALSLAKLLKN